MNRQSVRPIRATNEQMEYLIELWTTTNSLEPTVKQLILLCNLLETKEGANPDTIWSREHLTRRDVGNIIHTLLKLSNK